MKNNKKIIIVGAIFILIILLSLLTIVYIRKSQHLNLECGKYTYGNCPSGCVKKCISSGCSKDGKTCTPDCGGKGSCSDPVPTDKKYCEAVGGRWGKFSMYLDEECNLPLKNGGKECSDSDECEGGCRINELEVDWNKAVNGAVYTKGKCDSWKIVVGCTGTVEDGKVERILCTD